MRRRPGQLQASPAQFREQFAANWLLCHSGVARPQPRVAVSKSSAAVMRVVHPPTFSLSPPHQRSRRETLALSRGSGGVAPSLTAGVFSAEVASRRPLIFFRLDRVGGCFSSCSFMALCFLHAILLRFKRHRRTPAGTDAMTIGKPCRLLCPEFTTQITRSPTASQILCAAWCRGLDHTKIL